MKFPFDFWLMLISVNYAYSYIYRIYCVKVNTSNERVKMSERMKKSRINWSPTSRRENQILDDKSTLFSKKTIMIFHKKFENITYIWNIHRAIISICINIYSFVTVISQSFVRLSKHFWKVILKFTYFLV